MISWTTFHSRLSDWGSCLKAQLKAQPAPVWVATISALAAVLSFTVNFYQFRTARYTERVRTAIEVAARTRLPEFVAAHRRVIDAQKKSSVTDTDYLMGEFNYLLTLYLNDLTDDCLIKAAFYDPMQAFRQVLDKLEHSYQLGKLDRALVKLSTTKCPEDTS